MKEYTVIRAFCDKDTMQSYQVDGVYQSNDSERIKFLQGEGFLGDLAHINHEGDELDERLKHAGGGYYELPNGEKVRGRNKALEKLKELEESPSTE